VAAPARVRQADTAAGVKRLLEAAAAHAAEAPCVRRLLSSRDLRAPSDTCPLTPLQFAARLGACGAADGLLFGGRDVDAAVAAGPGDRTPARTLAGTCRHAEAVTLLLCTGADASAAATNEVLAALPSAVGAAPAARANDSLTTTLPQPRRAPPPGTCKRRLHRGR
jgi:hypothetical protein